MSDDQSVVYLLQTIEINIFGKHLYQCSYRRGGVVVERSHRMREIGVRSTVGTEQL